MQIEPPRNAVESNGSLWAACSSQISFLVGLANLLVSAVFSVWIWDKLKLQIPDEPEHAATHLGELGLQVVTPIPVHKLRLSHYLKWVVPGKIASQLVEPKNQTPNRSTYWPVLPFNPCQNWFLEVQRGIIFAIKYFHIPRPVIFPWRRQEAFLLIPKCQKVQKTLSLSESGFVPPGSVSSYTEVVVFSLLFSTLLFCDWNYSLQEVP